MDPREIAPVAPNNVPGLLDIAAQDIFADRKVTHAVHILTRDNPPCRGRSA